MFKGIPWQDVCKFLAGAFFVNAGVLFYLYLARVSVPILGTGLIQTPDLSGLPALHCPCRSLFDVLLPWFYSQVENRPINRTATLCPDSLFSLTRGEVAKGCHDPYFPALKKPSSSLT